MEGEQHSCAAITDGLGQPLASWGQGRKGPEHKARGPPSRDERVTQIRSPEVRLAESQDPLISKVLCKHIESKLKLASHGVESASTVPLVCLRWVSWSPTSLTEPTFPSKSDAPGASGPATEPGSRLTPPKRPTAGTTGVVRPEPSQVPPQTTAKALEHTPSVSQDPPGAVQYRARAVTAAVSVLVAVLGAVCVGLLLVCYRRSRQINQIPGVEMESTEVVPMAGGTNTRGEGTEH
ncbi:interleukin-15 receptor subunit alpha isoform X3 [Camelus bactrianus]|uniref:Interleukin-15 receptor subunit alpha isoform X3 n=1 Tax=Camelus bactrianus TaxID=9837 RepID=A0AC58PWA3_CAMBA